MLARYNSETAFSTRSLIKAPSTPSSAEMDLDPMQPWCCRKSTESFRQTVFTFAWVMAQKTRACLSSSQRNLTGLFRTTWSPSQPFPRQRWFLANATTRKTSTGSTLCASRRLGAVRRPLLHSELGTPTNSKFTTKRHTHTGALLEHTEWIFIEKAPQMWQLEKTTLLGQPQTKL